MHDAFAYCAALVRAADRDRFIASLFAPAELRGALHALYAFNSEVVRVREAAREVLPGEIRLQWWSEAINGERTEEASANPVASALLQTIERHRLRTALLIELIDAHRFDLQDEPMASLADFESYARKTSSALIALAAQILTGAEIAAVAEPAGIAYAMAGLLCAFPAHIAQRRLYVPVELLERHHVRRHELFAGRSSAGLESALAELQNLAYRRLVEAHERMGTLPQRAIPALLPVALVRPALDRLRRSRPFAPTEIPAWRRQWLIWRAARNPSRIAC